MIYHSPKSGIANKNSLFNIQGPSLSQPLSPMPNSEIYEHFEKAKYVTFNSRRLLLSKKKKESGGLEELSGEATLKFQMGKSLQDKDFDKSRFVLR